MSTYLTPLRWPREWKDPSLLDLLKNSGIGCILADSKDVPGFLKQSAEKNGWKLLDPAGLPAEIHLVKGVWPGVKLTSFGAKDVAEAGPTGVPWVDSNGWLIGLQKALHPDHSIWVDAPPEAPRTSARNYVLAIADAAAHGAAWVLTLENSLAAGVSAGNPEALSTWKKITDAVTFFGSHSEWKGLQLEAVIGVLSDFSGKNEIMSQEILNLLARTNQPYSIYPKNPSREYAWDRLKVLIYPDEEQPQPVIREQVLQFVKRGGLLITSPNWGPIPEAKPLAAEHPRYAQSQCGKGRIAIAQPTFEDPYQVAQDSVILLSHRNDLLRFWNEGAIGSYFTIQKDRQRALLQILFYASRNPREKTTVRIAGNFQSARLWTLEQPNPQSLPIATQSDAVECYLPPVSNYAAIELFMKNQ